MAPREHDPLSRVEALMETITRAHTAVFELHRRLGELGLADPQSRALLDDSIRIATQQAPATAREARQAVFDDTLQRLLEPAPSEILPAAEQAIARAEERLLALLGRQREIAEALRSQAERDR